MIAPKTAVIGERLIEFVALGLLAAVWARGIPKANFFKCDEAWGIDGQDPPA
jgi:hypothetical protein